MDILFRVEHGLFADRLLAEAFKRGLPKRLDRAFLQEMVYGVVRRRGTLDAVIAAYSDIGLRKLETRLLLALRLGVYQLLYMSRVPQSAAVNETVGVASDEKRGRNFCNAVLRAVSSMVRFDETPAESERSLEVATGRYAVFNRAVFTPLEENPAACIAAKYSHPESLVARWIERFGVDETIEICSSNNRLPLTFVRRNPLRISQDDFLAELRSEFANVRSVEGGMFSISGGRIFASHLLETGRMTVQDPTAALVAPFLDPQPDENLLDLCAAPGGKAAHIAELTGDSGRLVVVDSSHDRVRLLEETRRRLGLNSVEIVHADGREYGGAHPAEFDRVLVDAPCSNTGVLARRLEARWRFGEAKLVEMTALQNALLNAGACALKPGGVLVYSTCSMEEEENSAVVRAFLDSHDDFTLEDSREYFPHRGIGDGGYMARLRSR